MFKIKEFEICSSPIEKFTVIDTMTPDFSWKLLSDKNNATQKMYHIVVRNKNANLIIYDSGCVQSEDNCAITLHEVKLLPCTEYVVHLETQSCFGETAYGEYFFETAFLDGTFTPWADAEFIGAPEYYVSSENIGVFALETTLFHTQGRAGILFGANDYRLENTKYNELGVSAKNYILYAIDADKAELLVYRAGYCKSDRSDVPLATAPIEKNISYAVRIEVTGNAANAYVNGTFVNRVQLNPIRDNSITTYPRLNNIGYYVCHGTVAQFDGITLKYLRSPANIFYTCDHKHGVTLDGTSGEIYKLFSPDCHALPMVRRRFFITKKILKARLYVASRGSFECRINGRSSTDEYFPVGASQFDKHLYYKTFDVTDLVKAGDNCIGFTLFSGWWCGSQTYVIGCFNLWGDKESVMAKLVLTYEDGKETIVTNSSEWEYYGEGAYKFGGFFQGERLDGRQMAEYDLFSTASFHSDKIKRPMKIITDIIPKFDSYSEMNRTIPVLTGKRNSPVKAVANFPSVSVYSPENGVWIYDIGQEIAGTVRITFKGKRGEMAVIRYAEMVYPELKEYGELSGHVLTANLRDASSTDKYILNGNSAGEIYSPRFTFHGFRYIEISGVVNAPKLSDVIGIQLSSVFKITGKITTDNKLVNRLVKNAAYGMMSNFISIPTDCPQRDERLGWAGDTHIFCKTALYFADTKAFYIRYLEALRDGQREDGRLPDIAPVGGGFGGITYGSAMVFIINELYCFYGDIKIISDYYETMSNYMNYLAKCGMPGNADVGPIDDWLAPQSTDKHLVWNAFYGRLCNIMARFAEIIGRVDEHVKYNGRLSQTKEYFCKTFLTQRGVTLNADGTRNNTMGSYAITLSYEMVDDELKKRCEKNLRRCVKKSHYKITTGFFGTALVTPALSKSGLGVDAYKMLTQKKCPGWLYSVLQGATTIWERWNGYTKEEGFGGMNSMNSFNHYAFGSVISWIYEYAAGIKVYGPRNFIIQPEFSGFKNITSGFETPCGYIESSYSISNGTVSFSCTIPVNAHCTLILPHIEKKLGSGQYRFCFTLK